MRHLLMDPAFPDIVGEWASESLVYCEFARSVPEPCNDDQPDDPEGAFIALLGQIEIAATRLW
jgi:hypothetical protein